MNKGETLLNQLAEGKVLLQKELPEAMTKFQELHDTILKDGKLSVRQKRLIGLGMALVLKCDYCIAIHLKAIKDMGIGFDEVLEVCSMAMLMHGGPGFAYSTLVARLWNEI
ncbi:carboxymuconolactone decarboxylase family protein [Desulfoscipio geothermicus]|uniref:Alkylhydroperoxidase AhpD family core domain-containing protein n=1 Tax=Desulfoscipio geothermicus DSM 3669 TaxID=1121426 RepID=A0A1I6DYI8_9FIRM|nr:carboxymuconolactone decarboxylase family protein [Desulfoscipio geothermicus]SFR10486.1 alkylhydroperoxidase AhpD family core domain-containing protein [Desulfoscipio geothermicus DSM 3669]